MAMCYQKLGILEECSICLEACIDHLESDYLQNYFNNPEQPSLRLKMLKYKCKTHMQICALLSQIHKHKEALFVTETFKLQPQLSYATLERKHTDVTSVVNGRIKSVLPFKPMFNANAGPFY